MLEKTRIRIYFTLGLLFFLLAIIGVILPLLPTTPFALLAIYFFDRSSPKFHAWCLKIPGVGEGISDWQKFGVIRKKAKVQSTILLALSAVFIALKESLDWSVKALIYFILLSVFLFILSRKSKIES